MLSQGVNGQDFNRPTGRIYTELDLLKRLKRSYDIEAVRRLSIEKDAASKTTPRPARARSGRIRQEAREDAARTGHRRPVRKNCRGAKSGGWSPAAIDGSNSVPLAGALARQCLRSRARCSHYRIEVPVVSAVQCRPTEPDVRAHAQKHMTQALHDGARVFAPHKPRVHGHQGPSGRVGSISNQCARSLLSAGPIRQFQGSPGADMPLHVQSFRSRIADQSIPPNNHCSAARKQDEFKHTRFSMRHARFLSGLKSDRSFCLVAEKNDRNFKSHRDLF